MTSPYHHADSRVSLDDWAGRVIAGLRAPACYLHDGLARASDTEQTPEALAFRIRELIRIGGR